MIDVKELDQKVHEYLLTNIGLHIGTYSKVKYLLYVHKYLSSSNIFDEALIKEMGFKNQNNFTVSSPAENNQFNRVFYECNTDAEIFEVWEELVDAQIDESLSERVLELEDNGWFDKICFNWDEVIWWATCLSLINAAEMYKVIADD